MRPRAEWQATSIAVRWAFVVLTPLGLLLALSGVLIDGPGSWWTEHAFVTNVASNLVGAFVGIPIALVVLERLSRQQAARLELIDVYKLSWEAGFQFCRAAFRPIRMWKACSQLDIIVNACTEITEAAGEIEARLSRGEYDRASEAAKQAKQSTASLQRTLRDLLDVHMLSIWQSDVEARWRFIDEHVRARAYGAGTFFVGDHLHRETKEAVKGAHEFKAILEFLQSDPVGASMTRLHRDAESYAAEHGLYSVHGPTSYSLSRVKHEVQALKTLLELAPRVAANLRSYDEKVSRAVQPNKTDWEIFEKMRAWSSGTPPEAPR